MDLVVRLLAQVIDDEAQPRDMVAERREEIGVRIEELLEGHRRGPPVLAVVEHDGDNHRELAGLASLLLGRRGQVEVPDPHHVAHELEGREVVRVRLVLPEDVEMRIAAGNPGVVEEVGVAVLEVLVDEGAGPNAKGREVDARGERGGSAVARTPRACSTSEKANLTRLSWLPMGGPSWR
ncbi:MAG: hypothetical protein U0359_09300 [Byssovorax sp.]